MTTLQILLTVQYIYIKKIISYNQQLVNEKVKQLDTVITFRHKQIHICFLNRCIDIGKNH